MARKLLLLVASSSLAVTAACVHDARLKATSYFVSGRVYACGVQYAAGKTMRLTSGGFLLAADVVGPDGRFVLHPKEEQAVGGPVYLEVDGHKSELANDYAPWLQNGHYETVVRLGCSLREVDGGVPRPATTAVFDYSGGARTPPGGPSTFRPPGQRNTP